MNGNTASLKKRIVLWLPVIGWAGLIFYLSGIPHLKTTLGVWDLILRKAAHLVEYGVLALFLFRAWRGSFAMRIRYALWICFVISGLYAVSDEFHQSFIAGRHGSPMDVGFDVFGALCALWGRSFLHMRGILPAGCRAAVLALFFFAAGCGSNYHFKLAELYESRGNISRANHHYQEIIDAYPHLAARAMFRQGDNFRKDMMYDAARRLYRKVVDGYSGTEWAKKSMLGIMASPDYFPLESRRTWVEGDSQTGGKNMKLYISCTQLKGRARIRKKYFAGKKEVTELSQMRYVTKAGLAVREFKDKDSSAYTVLLKYPLDPGNTWRSVRDGRTYIFRVVAVDEKVSVKAGRFENCVKISEQDVMIKGSRKFVYYAPGVGRILTTVQSAGSSKEYRNTELLSHGSKPLQ